MVVLGGGAVPYERGTPVDPKHQPPNLKRVSSEILNASHARECVNVKPHMGPNHVTPKPKTLNPGSDALGSRTQRCQRQSVLTWTSPAYGPFQHVYICAYTVHVYSRCIYTYVHVLEICIYMCTCTGRGCPRKPETQNLKPEKGLFHFLT